jgi:Carboxypeptidase regulatory-like domain/TonB dependent receptor
MQFSKHSLVWGLAVMLGIFLSSTMAAPPASPQSGYTAQLTGVVTDSSGAVIPNAKVTLTNEGTNVSVVRETDGRGVYVLTNLRPSTYTIIVEAPNMAPMQRRGLVLAVAQQATLDFTLSPKGVSESVTVTEQAPLLDTGNATLGTDVTNEYVRDIPLYNRSMFGLVFLAGGVTETTGAGTQDPYPNGTNFVSNGQRNATAEVRLDGALTSAPEQGEGGNSNVYYQPSVEIVQEFKVENNSFSAEYGNNGGTLVNMVLKSGTNKFHGSGWWYLQRAALDANLWFLNAANQPRPDHVRDQYGFSLGGPIHKGKTFFFVDFERLRQHDPVVISGTVPTDAMRQGDFSQVSQTLYDPFQCNLPPNANSGGQCTRQALLNNQIPLSEQDPVGQKLLSFYPQPNLSGTGTVNNFRTSILTNSPTNYQFDVKVDHQFGADQRLAVRYSRLSQAYDVPFVLGSGSGTFNDGFNSATDVQNVGIEYNWSVKPTLVWTNRFAVDRAVAPVTPNMTPSTLQAAGLPSYLAQANFIDRMPSVVTDGTDNWLSMYTQCCTNTSFAHTLYSYSTSLTWIKGSHTFKGGFEQRQFFNNFWQPNYPTGYFYFPQGITAQFPGDPSITNGNSFATMLMGWADSGSLINILPSVADKSYETGFYFQDDWKVSSRLTINLGLRYEWSSPYTERHNLQQFSDFTGDTGVAVNLPNVANPVLGQPPANETSATEVKGITLFPFQGGTGRSVPTDRNNLAPRVGFAFSLTPTTVVRGGAGVYYGMSPATNFQYPGTVYSGTGNMQFSLDNNVTRNTAVTLSNPFPSGLPEPQGQAYGQLAMWGFDNGNNVGLEQARNADIYQWNLGVQHLFPWEITVGVDYSANRSTHLPFGGYSSTRNRNFISSTQLAQISSQLHSQDPTCDADSCVTNYLQSTLVDNPFYSYFQGPSAIFNQPASLYNQPQIPLYYLLRPYPQFAGSFQALPNFGANSFYNAMIVRFQKRMNHYFSFEGNYTFSKAMDDNSIGSNAFVGNLNLGNPQQLDRLKNEWAISANDATHRIVLAAIFELPVGRGLWIGHDMNRVLDAFVGGWQLAGIFTYQTGQPLPVSLAVARLQDGNQRPNVGCSNPGSGFSYHQAAANGLNQAAGATVDPYSTSVLNPSCFSDPGDQIPGNAPRYISHIRADGIRNGDLSLIKLFTVHEGMTLQLRLESLNVTNTPRFGFPNLAWAPGPPDGVNSTFGQVTSQVNLSRKTQIGLRFQF